MDKRKVISEVQAYLAGELSELSDNELERREEVRRLLLMYRFLPVREFGPEDVICPASLVELETNGVRAFYFIAPQGGGLITRVEGKPVQVLTPNSPIGEAVMGKKVGDTVEVAMKNHVRQYKIVGMS